MNSIVGMGVGVAGSGKGGEEQQKLWAEAILRAQITHVYLFLPLTGPLYKVRRPCSEGYKGAIVDSLSVEGRLDALGGFRARLLR
jgi:hypothetical protein